jgi:hypothetical protein
VLLAARQQRRRKAAHGEAQPCQPGAVSPYGIAAAAAAALPRASHAATTHSKRAQTISRGSVQDKSGEDANESGTREHRRGRGGVDVARAHTERVRPARAGVAHEPARGAIIAA